MPFRVGVQAPHLSGLLACQLLLCHERLECLSLLLLRLLSLGKGLRRLAGSRLLLLALCLLGSHHSLRLLQPLLLDD